MNGSSHWARVLPYWGAQWEGVKWVSRWEEWGWRVFFEAMAGGAGRIEGLLVSS